MKGYLKSVVPLGLVVSLFLLGATAWLSYRGLAEQVDTADWVTHTHIVLERLETLRAGLLKAESARRGFVLTGGNVFSEQFSSAWTAIQKAVGELRTLTADNASQQKRLDVLNPLIAERVRVLERSIEVLESKKPSAKEQLDLTMAGPAVTNQFVGVVNEMEDAERNLLLRRDASAKTSAEIVKLILLGGTLVSLAILLSIFAVLNREVTERERMEEAARLSEQRLNLASEAGQLGLWELDLVKDTAYRNLKHDQIFGYQSPQPQWSLEIFLNHIVPEDRGLVRQRFEEARTNGNLNFECRILWPDNSIHWISAQGRASRGDTGQLTRIMGSVIDVTARKLGEENVQQLNLDLRRRAQALEETNRELEAFTYSVSHDLRAPLRHVDGFSRLLLEEHGEQLGSEGKRLLTRVRAGTQQMGELVDDLLNLSRVSRREVNPLVTDLNTVVEQVITDLKSACQGRQVDFRVGRLRFAQCDPGLIRQVFANLLSNAIKFTRPRERAVIEVGQIEHDGHSAVFVRDNGVGFSMKYADKLFGVFQRLHRAEDFEGTGVGLATVQRIIQKHGGRIWVEAEIDKGATFYFTLEGLEERHPVSTEIAMGRRSIDG